MYHTRHSSAILVFLSTRTVVEMIRTAVVPTGKVDGHRLSALCLLCTQFTSNQEVQVGVGPLAMLLLAAQALPIEASGTVVAGAAGGLPCCLCLLVVFAMSGAKFQLVPEGTRPSRRYY